MTLVLLEKRRTGLTPDQRDLQDAMRAVWHQLDALDIDAERQILEAVEEMRRDVLDRLDSLTVTTDADGNETWQAHQLRTLDGQLRTIAEQFERRVNRRLSDDLRSAAEMSDLAHRQALSRLARALGVPPASIIMSPLGLSDLQVQVGITYSASAIKGVSERMITDVNREIQRVVFGGQSRWDATRNIRDLLAADPKRAGQKIGKLTTSAIRIERTSLISIFNAAALHSYKEALEEIPDLQIEWITLQDKRVDTTCTALSGKRVKPGKPFPGGFLSPPAHYSCRCRTVAWVPGWEKYG